MSRWFNRLAFSSLIALIFLCLSWELWLAPVRPGGSLLVLKTLPLLLPLFGILHGKRYTHQWTSMFSLLYLAEGSVRALSDQPPSQTFAIMEVLLSVLLFLGCTGYAYVTGSKHGVKSGD